ncbi:RHS repeat-associated core domain-containing protein [Flavobacterium lipolyticum]|uniref:RHS repeat-associated core domain-containing protein n=1 Tax=Flavobacterium lipolyticum TaxID=2893754 RepID=A0ABS8LZC9_9FLAO|nr:RHS repeat-associated core domain-containing protein [Flavobacterium sp. F-126]MCC9017928.1 RHS repeat-associated core domain-containing protein [Flavobacterium sp. F-126]
MTIKNHKIVLKDTSPGEMARFRHSFLNIWRQQIEDDKNTAKIEKFASKYTNKTTRLGQITIKNDLYDAQYINNTNKFDSIYVENQNNSEDPKLGDYFDLNETYTGSDNLNNKYKFNGMELQDELGLNIYDYGARNYAPALGRWMNIDPLTETSRRFSPYVYTNNNPVYFIDTNGMSAEGSGDPTYLLQSVNYDKKTGNYAIKENVTVSNSNSSSMVNEFGGTTEVTNTTTTSANFTTVVNSKGEIVSKSNSIYTTKTTTERNPSNILDTGKVTDSKTKKTSDKSLTGPLAKAFEGSVDGMKDLVVPLKSDLQNFRETTKDIPGAGDGTTGGFGRLGEALIDYVRGTATSYSSAMTKSKRSKLEDRDFNNAGYVIYSKTLKQVGTTLNKK